MVSISSGSDGSPGVTKIDHRQTCRGWTGERTEERAGMLNETAQPVNSASEGEPGGESLARLYQ
ncbi:MAG: hypothetical protein ACKOB4_12800, partial [Acidobacteriota bacterium]